MRSNRCCTRAGSLNGNSEVRTSCCCYLEDGFQQTYLNFRIFNYNVLFLFSLNWIISCTYTAVLDCVLQGAGSNPAWTRKLLLARCRWSRSNCSLIFQKITSNVDVSFPEFSFETLTIKKWCKKVKTFVQKKWTYVAKVAPTVQLIFCFQEIT